MAGQKEIRIKIGGFKNTQKITKAMQMLAASKMRGSQERFRAIEPYEVAITRIVQHLSHAHPEYHHHYLEKRPGNRRAVFVVTSDKGLCGGLNTNLYRAILRQTREWEKAGGTTKFGILGRKGEMFFGAIKAPVIAQAAHFGDRPGPDVVRGVLLSLIKEYEAGEIDSIWVASNKFVSTMIQKPHMHQVLPIDPSCFEVNAKIDAETPKATWDYLYEPEPQVVLDELLTRYVESVAYEALVENQAAEQSARMIAMQNATDNAGRIIKELQLMYNKARQASITQEIAEIVGGAAAV